jgi:hypothetical protein
MKRTALVTVGPPPARISGVEALPTWRNISIIGTVVGNIIATIPIIQEDTNKIRAIGSNANIPLSIIVLCWMNAIHQEAKATTRRPPATISCSGVKRALTRSMYIWFFGVKNGLD